MRNFNILKRFVVALTILLSACGQSLSNPVAGGAFGAAAGAGTGALVGSVIASGDIAMSALLGGAIGLPIGIALGLAWQKEDAMAEQQDRIARYIENQERITEREREIEALRQEVLRDSPRGQPDRSLNEHLYTGGTLGNPYR